MLATYMRRMRNNNLEIRIAGPPCRPQKFWRHHSLDNRDIQSKPPESEHQDLVVAY